MNAKRPDAPIRTRVVIGPDPKIDAPDLLGNLALDCYLVGYRWMVTVEAFQVPRISVFVCAASTTIVLLRSKSTSTLPVWRAVKVNLPTTVVPVKFDAPAGMAAAIAAWLPLQSDAALTVNVSRA